MQGAEAAPRYGKHSTIIMLCGLVSPVAGLAWTSAPAALCSTEREKNEGGEEGGGGGVLRGRVRRSGLSSPSRSEARTAEFRREGKETVHLQQATEAEWSGVE